MSEMRAKTLLSRSAEYARTRLGLNAVSERTGLRCGWNKSARIIQRTFIERYNQK